MNKKILISTILLLCFTVFNLAQQQTEKKDKVVGEVTVTATKANVDPVYVRLRKASENTNAFSGEYAAVSNLIMKRDAATFTLRSGEICGRRNNFHDIGRIKHREYGNLGTDAGAKFRQNLRQLFR